MLSFLNTILSYHVHSWPWFPDIYSLNPSQASGVPGHLLSDQYRHKSVEGMLLKLLDDIYITQAINMILQNAYIANYMDIKEKSQRSGHARLHGAY